MLAGEKLRTRNRREHAIYRDIEFHVQEQSQAHYSRRKRMAAHAAVNLFLSRDEAAAMLGVSVRFVDAVVRSGELQAIKLGRRVLIGRDALNDFVQRAPKKARVTA